MYKTFSNRGSTPRIRIREGLPYKVFGVAAPVPLRSIVYLDETMIEQKWMDYLNRLCYDFGGEATLAAKSRGK